MTPDEVWQFLASQPTLFFALVAADGYPFVTPVWFVLKDHVIWFHGASYKAKFALADGAKVCCTCADGERYPELRGVVIRGRSSVVRDSAHLDDVESRMRAKYADRTFKQAEVPEAWLLARRGETKTWIAVHPERISSWDNTKLMQPTGAFR
jgi:nitroimidazol reductase NimA-like FMN-containing flavoprotein (pyridoxamine 5'-phosphate oxidase superfamily)